MKKIFLISLIIISLLMAANLTLADDIYQNLESAAGGAGYSPTQREETTIPNMIGQIIAVVLGFVGSIFLVLTIYSGIQWMTAGGNEDKVKQARTRLINSIMGLAITIAAYFITWLISTTLLGT